LISNFSVKTSPPSPSAWRRANSSSTWRFNALEAERKAIQTRTEELQGKRNSLSKLIGMMKGKGEDTTAVMAKWPAWATS
jgi:seryl-tRNA synthetase